MEEINLDCNQSSDIQSLAQTHFSAQQWVKHILLFLIYFNKIHITPSSSHQFVIKIHIEDVLWWTENVTILYQLLKHRETLSIFSSPLNINTITLLEIFIMFCYDTTHQYITKITDKAGNKDFPIHY